MSSVKKKTQKTNISDQGKIFQRQENVFLFLSSYETFCFYYELRKNYFPNT